MRSRLKLFIEDSELSRQDLTPPQVEMELGEFTKILKDAVVWDRTWLQDMGDERIKISADLYELLSAYAQMRPSA